MKKGSRIIVTALVVVALQHLSNAELIWMKEDETLLQSERCASYMERVHANVGRLLELDDEDLIDFACRPSEADQQERLRKLDSMIGQEQEQHQQQDNECQAADTRLLLQDRQVLQRALASAADCEEAVESEIDLLYETDGWLAEQQQELSPLERQIRFAMGNLPVTRFVADCCGPTLQEVVAEEAYAST